ncbi:MAG: hypothetical protein ABL929_10960 [Ferruginibacter sp.]|nr:hypothetical protein [Ferruginibacter sp.]
MKKYISIFAMLLVSFTSFAQSANADYDDLMKQSKRARATSTIMVVTGPIVAAGGIGYLLYGVIGKSGVFDDTYDNSVYNPITGTTTYPNRDKLNKQYNNGILFGAIGAAAGIATAVSSTIFSSKASKLKKLARKTRLKATTDNIRIISGNNYAYTPTKQLKLSLTFSLGR